jgi:outer membrane murein-binding lipoprotein Lpp
MRRHRVQRFAAAAAVASSLIVSGCGSSPLAQDLCANAKGLNAAVAEVQALKPDGARLDALGAKVDAALARLDRFQAVTEGRYDAAISSLREKLTSFKEAVAAAGNEAFAAAAPQLTASLDELRSAYASLNESLATQCATE